MMDLAGRACGSQSQMLNERSGQSLGVVTPEFDHAIDSSQYDPPDSRLILSQSQIRSEGIVQPSEASLPHSTVNALVVFSMILEAPAAFPYVLRVRSNHASFTTSRH